jgi:hypothetical protein
MAQYADNDHKFVAVLNRKAELPQLVNALGHISAGLTSEHHDPAQMKFLQYQDADGGLHPGISYYPFIVLVARNGNQIRTLRQGAIDAGIMYCDFVDTMLGESADDQLGRTRQTREEDLSYLAIALFGAAAQIDPLTHKFSLFMR